MPNDLDILTYEEAVDAINLNQSRLAPTTLEVWVTAISQRVDTLCGPVVIREVTETLDPRGDRAFLTYWPVDSISSVTEYPSGTGSALTAETTTAAGGYSERNGVLYRRASFAPSYWGGTVVVTYNAGRYADTASVDAKFKLCASAILRRLWAREAGAWGRADPFGGEDQGSLGFFNVIEASVREWLADELRAPVVA